MKPLHIASEPKDFSIPQDLITQTLAILARKRVGKTYTASVIAEEFCKAKLPFVVLDPTGAWWGLRASSDGKAAGYPVIIIGGPHGDVPLEPTAGRVIADLVVDHPGYFVIDLSLTNSNAEQDRFATDFAEQLYRRKSRQPDPLHLFIDEADSFAPQRPFPGQQRMLGAFEAIVRRGGIRGIGVTMITQRPAILNKNVLTQTEVLIALQTTGPQDRAAVQEWVKSHGTKEQQETFMNSLAGLQKGQAWIWSPAWLNVFKLVKIRARATFNSSATPEVGTAQRVPSILAPVDLEALKGQMAATIEKAKADDPKALKAKIAQLERDLAAIHSVPAPQAKVEIVEVPLIKDADLDRLEKATAAISVAASLLADTIGKWKQAVGVRHVPAEQRHPRGERQEIRSVQMSAQGNVVLGTGGLRRMLIALAQRSQGLSDRQLGVRAGLSSSSGSFGTYLAKGRTNGWISGERGCLSITEAGLQVLGVFDPLPTGNGLLRYWLNELGNSGAARMLEALSAVYPRAMTKEELGAQVNLSHSSGSFGTYLSRLRTLELIEGRQELKASSEFVC
ncbi:MAG: hypothetical protein BVN29_08795 [Nitrospira sp. ST-bin5]|nr:MAG: hypothetical protein BVN29_08795 [Nitrospira sp. ST-bin5]